MNHEGIEKVSQDVERLIVDAKKLFADASNVGNHEISEIKVEGIALLNKALEQLNSRKKQIAQASDYAICKTKCRIHDHPLASLGIAALLGGMVGAILTRKLSKGDGDEAY